MKIQYISKRFGSSALDVIEKANEIIDEYAAQGFDLTLRQLFYQFVSKDLIPNTMREYKKLGSIINDARLAGLISWEAIVDRTRELRQNSHWESPKEILDTCIKSYAVDKWIGQEYRVEVWIEKDALVGVISGVCRSLDVPYFSCRGYTSQSEMWSAAMRLQRYKDDGQQPIIIHLGDHDPSGKDMSRDIQDRMNIFTSGYNTIDVERIALNMDQIDQYKPPPNPAKITDSRSDSYISEFGSESWELDALDPKIITRLIDRRVRKYIDEDIWNKQVRLEKKHKGQLVKLTKGLK